MPDQDGRPLTLAELERWVTFGGVWRAVSITDERAIVDLCQCTGEVVERRESPDPAVIGYLRSRARPLR